MADEPETTLDVATRIYEEQAAKAVEAEAVTSGEDKAKVTEVEVAKADEVDETKGSEATEVVAEEVKVDAEAVEADDVKATKDTPKADAKEAKEAKESTEPIDAPENWSLKDQTTFRDQPRAAQEWMIETEKAMAGAHTKRSQEIAPFRQAVEEWQPYLDQTSQSAPQVFKTLMATEYSLRTGTQEQKLGVIDQLMKAYGVALPQALTDPGVADGSADPEMLSLRQQLGETNGELQAFKAQMHNGAQERAATDQQSQVEAYTREIEVFAEAKGDGGKLLHPHFEEVRIEMGRQSATQLEEGKQPALADLYDSAIWAVPSVREKLIAKQRHEADVELRAAGEEKVRKAKATSVQVDGGGSPAIEKPFATTHEELTHRMAEAGFT